MDNSPRSIEEPEKLHRLYIVLALTWTLLIPAACTFDLNTEYYALTGDGDLMILSDAPEPFYATASLEAVEDYNDDPMPKTLTFNLVAKERDNSGTLTMELDKGPSKIGPRKVKGARLKLKGRPEVLLPADGWNWTAAFEVRWMQEYKLPGKDDRSCRDSYPTRSARVFLSLDATGPAGEHYSVNPAELDLEWTFMCEEFHL